MTDWPQLLSNLIDGRDLSRSDTTWVMDQVLSGDAPPVSVAAFLAALRAKGETPSEVDGLVESMLAHAHRIHVPGRTVDVVGTGGDGAHTVNVSTMASIVVAGAGLTVVKHGNKAASSLSGSADVLGELGVNLDLPPERVEALASEVGITFCFAMVFHPAMRFAGPIRKELGIATTFNLLGPLTNPAQPAASAVGVAQETLAPVMAGAFAARGRDAVVFRGHDGLDELAATAPATVWEVRGGDITQSVLDPVADLGLPEISIDDLRGGEASHNADIARRVLAGELGPVRDTVALNAAAGLVADATLPGTVAGTLVERFDAALALSRAAIDEGRAQAVLDRWVAASHA
jgi:anthranilate phosphoribosyltransferase